MKKNGFTLVELLAVIIILGLITGITYISITGAFKNAKDKTEEEFVYSLNSAIESYIKLNSSSLAFDNYSESCISKSTGNKSTVNKKLQSTTKSFSVVIDDTYNFKNPKSNDTCNKDTNITIYRDEDFVYYYKYKLDCLENASDEIGNLPEVTSCYGE